MPSSCRKRSQGYSLIELLIALSLIALLAAFVINVFHREGASDAVVKEAVQRLSRRRAEAIRLSAGLGASAVDRIAWQPPLTIDFADLATTAALRTGNCSDRTATHVVCPDGNDVSPTCYCLNGDGDPVPSAGWEYKYQNDAMRLPSSAWQVAATTAALPAGVPALSNTQPTTAISFEASGRVTPVAVGNGRAKAWAIYFVAGAKAARAVTVNESGEMEIWRWQPNGDEDGAWQGYNNRPDSEL